MYRREVSKLESDRKYSRPCLDEKDPDQKHIHDNNIHHIRNYKTANLNATVNGITDPFNY